MIDCRFPINGRIPLLHDAVRIFSEEYPDILSLTDRMMFLREASRFDIAPIVLDSTPRLERGMKRVVAGVMQWCDGGIPINY